VRDRRDNLWVQLCSKLASATDHRQTQLQAIQIKAKLHNEQVFSRASEVALGYQSRQMEKFEKMQVKQRHAEKIRESIMAKAKKSDERSNTA